MIPFLNFGSSNLKKTILAYFNPLCVLLSSDMISLISDLEAWLRTVAGMLHTSRVRLEISVSETVISDRVSVPDKSIIQAVQTLSRDHISLKVAGKVVMELPDWTSLRVGFGERQRKLTIIKNLK